MRLVSAFILFTTPGLVAASAPPADYDVVSIMQAMRMERPDAGRDLPRISDMLTSLLATPGSAYSALVPEPAFIGTRAWRDIAEGGLDKLGLDGALAILQYDLGATRARPGSDVVITPGFREDFVAASAIKASVDADIFWHTLDVVGRRHSTRAATYGIALQLLRDKAAVTPRDRWRATGIDVAILDRFMRARYLDELSRGDLTYLSTLVQHGMIHWRSDAMAQHGQRALPTPLRVARLAAAYRDAEGYVGGYPCGRDATPNATYAGTGAADDDRPLCFVAATDHAVLRWYSQEVRRQAAWVPNKAKHDLTGLLGLFALMVPLIDLAALLESTEAVIAEDLAVRDATSAAEVASLSDEADVIACRIPL